MNIIIIGIAMLAVAVVIIAIVLLEESSTTPRSTSITDSRNGNSVVTVATEDFFTQGAWPDSLNQTMQKYGMPYQLAKHYYYYDGPRSRDIYEYYTHSKTGQDCVLKIPIASDMPFRLVGCDDPRNHIVETKLSKIVSLEFNKEFFAEGLNRMAELKDLGYETHQMIDSPSTTWDYKPTTKYVVIMEKP